MIAKVKDELGRCICDCHNNGLKHCASCKDYTKLDDDDLIKRREELSDFFTPNGNNTDELSELLEVERELTLREEQ